MGLNEFNEVTDKRLLWNLIKYVSRQGSIKYSKRKSVQIEYNTIYEQLAKGGIIRSKAIWYEKGEKSNKYFLNLEAYKKAKSSIRKVFNNKGVVITDPKKILQDIQSIQGYVNRVFIELSDDDARICNGKLTVDEC